MDNSEEIARLRRELAESVRVADDDAVRRAYQDLLRAGQPRKQIMQEVMSLATASQHRPRVISENSAPFGLRAPEAETRSTSAEPEIHVIERLAAQFPLARAQLTTEAAPPLAPKPGVGDKADDQERRAPHFSRLRWAVVYAAVAIAALAAGTGGFIFFNGGEGKPVGVTAAIPVAPIEEPIAPAAPAVQERASAAPSEKKEAAAQASSGEGVGSRNPDAVPVAIPADEGPKEALPPAPTPSGGVSASPIESPASKATPDPALVAHGDAAFANRDLLTARLFYERAANAGDAQAALHLGQTYDPAFLAQIKARGVRPDASAAVRWYLQADKMGAPEAAMLLRALAKDLGISAPAQREQAKR